MLENSFHPLPVKYKWIDSQLPLWFVKTSPETLISVTRRCSSSPDTFHRKSLIILPRFCPLVLVLVSLKTQHQCALLCIDSMIHNHPFPVLVFFKGLSFSLSTSHFLMPILQENFPFIQKSSRMLVRDDWMLLHIIQDCQTLNRLWRCGKNISEKNVLLLRPLTDIVHAVHVLYIVTYTPASIWTLVCCSLQECYVHNLLRVTVYIPSIRRDVLEVIIERMLKLDVGSSTLQRFCHRAYLYSKQK